MKKRETYICQYEGGFSRYDGEEIELVPSEGKAQIEAMRRIYGVRDYFDRVNVIVSTDRYIAIPAELFDDKLSVSYLETKSLRKRENEIILTCEQNDIVFVMLASSDTYHYMAAKCKEIRVSHLLQKNIAMNLIRCNPVLKGVADKHLALSLAGNRLHVSYHDTKRLRFIETFEVANYDDLTFYLRTVISRLGGDEFQITVVSDLPCEPLTTLCESLAPGRYDHTSKELFYTL